MLKWLFIFMLPILNSSLFGSQLPAAETHQMSVEDPKPFIYQVSSPPSEFLELLNSYQIEDLSVQNGFCRIGEYTLYSVKNSDYLGSGMFLDTPQGEHILLFYTSHAVLDWQLITPETIRLDLADQVHLGGITSKSYCLDFQNSSLTEIEQESQVEPGGILYRLGYRFEPYQDQNFDSYWRICSSASGALLADQVLDFSCSEEYLVYTQKEASSISLNLIFAHSMEKKRIADPVNRGFRLIQDRILFSDSQAAFLYEIPNDQFYVIQDGIGNIYSVQYDPQTEAFYYVSKAGTLNVLNADGTTAEQLTDVDVDWHFFVNGEWVYYYVIKHHPTYGQDWFYYYKVNRKTGESVPLNPLLVPMLFSSGINAYEGIGDLLKSFAIGAGDRAL